MEDLFEDVKCIVCFKIYDENIIPKILTCGHTFCCQCIRRLEQEEDPHCPKCRGQLSFNTSVINYTVASMASALNQVSSNTHKEEEKREELRFIRNQMVVVMKNNIKFCDQIIRNLGNQIIRNWETLEEHLTDTDFVLEGTPVPIDKDFIKNEKKEILDQINKLTHKKSEPKLFATFTADEDPKSFLMKIYKRIEEGRTLLSFHQSNIDTGFAFGKITVWDNRIYFHSLSLVSPGNCEEFIKFDDLKKVSSKLTLRLFFKIPCKNSLNQLVMIRTVRSSLVLQFIKLCTGETGFCYAGSSFKYCGKAQKNGTTTIIELTHYKSVPDKSLCVGNLDYVLETKKKTSNFFEPNTVIVGSGDGSFKVMTVDHKDYYMTYDIGIPLGIIESPANLKNTISNQESKILDSGIAFYIEN